MHEILFEEPASYVIALRLAALFCGMPQQPPGTAGRFFAAAAPCIAGSSDTPAARLIKVFLVILFEACRRGSEELVIQSMAPQIYLRPPEDFLWMYKEICGDHAAKHILHAANFCGML